MTVLRRLWHKYVLGHDVFRWGGLWNEQRLWTCTDCGDL